MIRFGHDHEAGQAVVHLLRGAAPQGPLTGMGACDVASNLGVRLRIAKKQSQDHAHRAAHIFTFNDINEERI